jgi:hypothetical protein
MESDRSQTSPVVHQLDYRARTDESFPWAHFLHWSRAVAVVALAFAAGLYAERRYRLAGQLAIPPIWLAGMWYVAARAYGSRAAPGVKFIKAIVAVSIMAMTPFIWCTYPNPLTYAVVYRWNDKLVFGNASSLLYGLLLLLFAAADMADMLLRWRNKRV